MANINLNGYEVMNSKHFGRLNAHQISRAYQLGNRAPQFCEEKKRQMKKIRLDDLDGIGGQNHLWLGIQVWYSSTVASDLSPSTL